MLFRQMVIYAFLIGAIAGVLLTAVQSWQVIPIIQDAEHFEEHLAAMPGEEAHTGHSHAGHDHDHDHGGTAHGGDHSAAHSHDHDHAHPEGVQRVGYTLMSNAMIGGAFALILVAAMIGSVRSSTARQLDWRHGLLWGGAGYVVFFLAPSMGLPPEIPGQSAAALESRQIWWLFAVACTAGGLAGLAFLKSPWRWAALGLVIVPHLIGAPQPPAGMFAEYPAAMQGDLEALARQFFGATALANGIFWLTLGLASAWAVRRIVSTNSRSDYNGA